MLAALISFLIYAVVLGLIVWLVFWAMDQLAMPEPLGKVIRVAVTVIAVLILILMLLNLAGVAPFDVPRPLR